MKKMANLWDYVKADDKANDKVKDDITRDSAVDNVPREDFGLKAD